MRNAIRVPFDGSQARGNAKQTPYEMPFVSRSVRTRAPNAEKKEIRRESTDARSWSSCSRQLVHDYANGSSAVEMRRS